MTETYKAGEIEVSVKLDTSALKGEFAALNQTLAKSGQEASKGFWNAFGAEFKGSKDKYRTSVFDIFDASKEAKNAGAKNIQAFAKGMDVSNVAYNYFGSVRKVTVKESKKSVKQFWSTGKAMGSALVGALRSAVVSTGIGLIFEGISFLVSKAFSSLNEYFNSAAIAGKKAGETLENVGSDIEGLGTAYDNLTTQTQTLEEQTLELNKAIDSSGSKAETAAQKEIAAINKRIAKNKELQRVYLDDARLKLQAAKEAQETADIYALVTILEEERNPFNPLNTINANESDLNVDPEFRQETEFRLKAERDELSKKRDELEQKGLKLSADDLKKFKTLNQLYKDRAENAQKVLEAEQRVAALETPKISEPKTPENGPTADGTNNTDYSNSDLIDKKGCEEKCDEKVRHIETRQKVAVEPEFNKEDDKAARKAEEEAELHRQRIERAEELKRQADGPLGEYRAQLEKIKEVERNSEAKEVAGGDENISSAKLDALRELASATEDYGIVLNELDALLKAEEITVEQYGRAFEDVIQSISDTDEALELLGSRAQNDILGDSPVKKAAIDEANTSLKTSEEYLEAINAKKREALELEAQEIENKLLLAEIGDGEPIDVKALRERLAIIRENLDLLQRGFTSEQAEEIAPKLAQSGEYNDLEADVKDLFKGGIKAALDGDFEDFLSGKLQGAADSMFDNALDTLLDGLLGAGGPLEGLIGSLFGSEGGGIGDIFGSIFGGGKSGATDGATDALGTFTEGLTAAEGGLGGFGGALSSIFGGGGGLGGGIGGILGGLFAGFFADGGVVPKGQFAIVGEQGPEIITAGASPLRVTPMNDNIATSHAARMVPDGGGGGAMSYAPINNFYGHTQDDLRRSLDERDRALKTEMPGMMDRHTFNRKRGMA